MAAAPLSYTLYDIGDMPLNAPLQTHQAMKKGNMMLTNTHSTAIEEGDPLLDTRAFRRCLGQFATGVTIVTAEADGLRVGVTANSFSSLSLDPPLVLWSIARTSRSFAAFEKCEHFAVNILTTDQIEVSQRFSSSEADKFAGVAWRPGMQGAPVIDGVAAVFECSTEQVYDGGDHIILIGRVHNYARYVGKVLLYSQGQYGIAEDHPALKKEPSSDTKHAARTFKEDELPLSTLLYFAHHYSSAAFEKHRREEGISLAQSRVISALNDAGSLSFEDLVGKVYLSEMATEDAIADLIKRSCLVRDIAGSFSLSEGGKRLLSAIRSRVAEYEAEQFSDASPHEIAVTRKVLSSFIWKLKPETRN
jgi:flavin reductase (DIM6/NTAB) family NADH-FMN oxidoreductase RutF/DNA-binding MarR family transcriptional regulator